MALRGGLMTASGCAGVEGVRLVEEAFLSGCRIEAILFSDAGDRHRARLAGHLEKSAGAVPVLKTTDRLFEGIADTENPQGVAALVQPKHVSMDSMLRPPAGVPLLAVLAGVQDPGNVGTILRTVAAFGATGAVTCASGQSGTANPFSPKALRASAGATLHLPVIAGMSLPILIAQLRVAGVTMLASSVRAPGERDPGAAAPWTVDWRAPVALLIGNEGAGLPEEVERSADVRVRIPMADSAESLNAGAAAAVLFYEAARQRNLLNS